MTYPFVNLFNHLIPAVRPRQQFVDLAVRMTVDDPGDDVSQIDDALIERLAERSVLPVNVMVMDGVSPIERLAELGAARISFGNVPYVTTMDALGDAARNVYAR